MNLADLLRHSAERHPERAALIEADGPTVTYGQMYLRARSLAGGLAALGVGGGDRVAILTRNRVEWVESFLATALCGGIAVPLNRRLPEADLEALLVDAAPRVLVTDDPRRFAGVADGMQPRRVQVGGGGFGIPYASLGDGRPPAPAPETAAADPAAILYTSGTTGGPKGVVLTHLNFVVGNFLLQASEFGLGAEDVFLVSTPLCHRVGATRVMTAAGLGATCVILPSFEPAATAAAIEAHGVTVVGTVPTVIRLLGAALGERRFPSVRSVLLTGERVTSSARVLASRLFPRATLHVFYASTEGGVSTLAAPEDSRVESCGRPALGVELRIAGAGPDGAGEILVRSDAPGVLGVGLGYWRAGRVEPFAGGWYHTGDIGRIEPDGTLTVLDRRKDVIISGGYNVYCPDLEAVLRSVPGVEDAAVAGLPDPVYGERVCAFVVAAPHHPPELEDLQSACRDRVPGYAMPRQMLLVDRLPRNALGKVVKQELRRMGGSFEEHRDTDGNRS